MRYTENHLKKLENSLKENNIKVRYEKGSFSSGFCLLQQQGVVIVNKYFTTEGKINSLIEVMNRLSIADNESEQVD
jgi:orotate phosphoribosyltransferase-like protein